MVQQMTNSKVLAWDDPYLKFEGRYVLKDPSHKKPHCILVSGEVKRFKYCKLAPPEDDHKPLWDWTLQDFHKAQDKGVYND